MPVNFSTIRPMNPSTISRMPAYTANPETPAASNPISDQAGGAKKKKSHWFLKTLAAVAVIAGGAALLRGKVDMFKNFDVNAVLPQTATFVDKAKHYAMKGVAVAGDFLISNATAAYNWAKNLIKKPTP